MAISSSPPRARPAIKNNTNTNSSSNNKNDKRSLSRTHSCTMGLLTRTCSSRQLSGGSKHSSTQHQQGSNSTISVASTTTKTMDDSSAASSSSNNRRGLLCRSPGSLRDFNNSDHHSGGTKRRIFRRNSTTTVSSRSLQQQQRPTTTTKEKKKRVHFAPSRTTLITVLPKRTERDIALMFYNAQEMAQQEAQGKRIAEESAWKKMDETNTNGFGIGGHHSMLACLHHLYGWKSSSGLSTEQALIFLYSYKATEEDGTRTTVRGLERLMSLKLADRQSATIQAVLNMQLKLKKTSSSSSKHNNNNKIEEQLAQVSMAASARAQRFACILGKADESVVCEKHNTKRCHS